MNLGYRPIKFNKPFKDITIREAIEMCEITLFDFSQGSRFDAGERLVALEAYLQGLLDSKKFKGNRK